MTLSLIAAMAENRVIGRDGKMPWHIPGELKLFKEHTLGKVLILGRKTHESIGQVLPGRTTIIITRQPDYTVAGATVVQSLDEALALAGKAGGEVMIGGGGELYRQTIDRADYLYLSLIHAEFEGDTFFPELPAGRFREKSRQEVAASIPYSFIIYERANGA